MLWTGLKTMNFSLKIEDDEAEDNEFGTDSVDDGDADGE